MLYYRSYWVYKNIQENQYLKNDVLLTSKFSNYGRKRRKNLSLRQKQQ